jgi:hypothetical protein
MANDFSTLTGIYDMMQPADLAGTQGLSLGGDPKIGSNAFNQLLSVLENNGRGVYTASDLKEKLSNLTLKSSDGNIDLSEFIQFFSTQGILDLGKLSDAAKTYKDAKGNAVQVSGIQEIIGKDFQLNGDAQQKLPFDTTIILSRSPFFHPATRNTKKAETFLNSMPSTILASLSPYLQVEFQVKRDPSHQLQAPGLLKFLLGAVDKNGQDATSMANKAMIEGHEIKGNSNTPEIDFAGMEMFTSPQTLVNPQPNLNVGTDGNRYVDVIDPFRPFASLEHCTITAVPAVGMYSYKTASLVIKLHDRSRLNEISDLIRPRVYTGVTVWMTYGWRAPVRPGENPYFDYVNNTMLMREAYGIINSNFTFDNVGQVTITLQLFTKGVIEMRESKISDNINDIDFQFKQIKIIADQISEYRKKLKLDPPDGISKEIRRFLILDAAEQGEFPNLKVQDVTTAINQLRATLGNTKGIDKDALNGMITSLQQLYAPATNDKTKFSLRDRYESRVTSTINAMFDEAITGTDPFLPISLKNGGYKPLVGDEIATICDSYNSSPKTPPVNGLARKALVSFGKLFMVFVVRNLISANVTDELQVFFYNLNESCGPVSGHSIAEFPIDMLMFKDQYRQHVQKIGSERITLEDFLLLIINAQFQDNRSVGYGMSAFYEAYDPKNPDAKLKDHEGEENSQLGKYLNKWGTFKKPVIEMYIETTHQRVPDTGYTDILTMMDYSAVNSATLNSADLHNLASKKIMRIHVYDKQMSPRKAATQLLRADDKAGGFISIPATDFAIQKTTDKTLASIPTSIATVQSDLATGHIQIVDFTSNQQMKDFVSKMVPTIRFGSNGSTITNAQLASKADALLSTVQMIRTMTMKNSAHANGSGEGGVPLRVIPAQLTLTTLGNVLATMAQQYMVDFQTGTTLDNLYIVVGTTHTFAPGKFETTWQMGYSDAYGVFEGPPNVQKWISQFPATVTGATG